MKKGINLAEKNGMWKGDNVGYKSLHQWITNKLDKPKRCEKCRKEKKVELANRSGKYLRRLDDWDWLCRKCHMESDGRFKNLKQYHVIKRITYRITQKTPAHTNFSLWVNGGLICTPGGLCLRNDEFDEFIKKLGAISDSEWYKRNYE